MLPCARLKDCVNQLVCAQATCVWSQNTESVGTNSWPLASQNHFEKNSISHEIHRFHLTHVHTLKFDVKRNSVRNLRDRIFIERQTEIYTGIVISSRRNSIYLSFWMGFFLSSQSHISNQLRFVLYFYMHCADYSMTWRSDWLRVKNRQKKKISIRRVRLWLGSRPKLRPVLNPRQRQIRTIWIVAARLEAWARCSDCSLPSHVQATVQWKETRVLSRLVSRQPRSVATLLSVHPV